MRGRLHLGQDSTAHLQMGDSLNLFDLASPVSAAIDGAWVDISVGRGTVALYPYQV